MGSLSFYFHILEVVSGYLLGSPHSSDTMPGTPINILSHHKILDASNTRYWFLAMMDAFTPINLGIYVFPGNIAYDFTISFKFLLVVMKNLILIRSFKCDMNLHPSIWFLANPTSIWLNLHESPLILNFFVTISDIGLYASLFRILNSDVHI